MNEVYKTKSQLREETSEALQQFLARGGQVQVVKARKAPKQKMNGKTSRSVSPNNSLGYRTSNFGG
jgi:hypothetical protein